MSSLIPFLPSTPEAQGIPSAAINAFVNAAEQLDALHSFMLLRHGHLVAEGWWEPYGSTDPHILFSLSKSFTSTAVGLLIAEGRLSVDDPVLRFFAEEAPPEPSANLQAMRIHHLLSMSTGHTSDTMFAMMTQQEKRWTQVFLEQPVEGEPGRHFLYQNGPPYLLAALVYKLTGEHLLDYLQPRLFAPLGIVNPRWETSPEGIELGGWGMSLTTADIAKFGQLYLQEGVWQGKRLLPEAWVAAATTRQVANDPALSSDWEQGYGYYFWRCQHGAYRGDGAFGQYCVVMPEQDAVLAMTGGLFDMQPPLDLVWEHLLTAMGTHPLPENRAAQKSLTAKLASLQLPTQTGSPTSPMAADISDKRYLVADNSDEISEIRFDFAADKTRVAIHSDQGEQEICCGYGQWQRNVASLAPLDTRTPFVQRPPEPWKIAASGAWIDETTYRATLWWYETPFSLSLTCRFMGDEVTVEQQANVGFGPLKGARLHGRVA
jgi:CubicO group peptidase (beta-lactamase class C family)